MTDLQLAGLFLLVLLGSHALRSLAQRDWRAQRRTELQRSADRAGQARGWR